MIAPTVLLSLIVYLLSRGKKQRNAQLGQQRAAERSEAGGFTNGAGPGGFANAADPGGFGAAAHPGGISTVGGEAAPVTPSPYPGGLSFNSFNSFKTQADAVYPI